MICAGDEMGRTQGGNNNAYAQDNEISWLSWDLSDEDRALLDFARRVSRLRREHPVFHRRHFFQGRRIRGSELEDITWLLPDGCEMAEDEWNSGTTRCFGMRLGGDAMLEWDERGERVTDDTFLLLFNGNPEPEPFTLPGLGSAVVWTLVLTTAEPDLAEGSQEHQGGAELTLPGRSVTVLLRRVGG